MCLNTGTPKNINFSYETNGKLMALGVPILKHFRVPPCFSVSFTKGDNFYDFLLAFLMDTALPKWGVLLK